jgi:hypothetical protein
MLGRRRIRSELRSDAEAGVIGVVVVGVFALHGVFALFGAATVLGVSVRHNVLVLVGATIVLGNVALHGAVVVLGVTDALGLGEPDP